MSVNDIDYFEKYFSKEEKKNGVFSRAVENRALYASEEWNRGSELQLTSFIIESEFNHKMMFWRIFISVMMIRNSVIIDEKNMSLNCIVKIMHTRTVFAINVCVRFRKRIKKVSMSTIFEKSCLLHFLYIIYLPWFIFTKKKSWNTVLRFYKVCIQWLIAIIGCAHINTNFFTQKSETYFIKIQRVSNANLSCIVLLDQLHARFSLSVSNKWVILFRYSLISNV